MTLDYAEQKRDNESSVNITKGLSLALMHLNKIATPSQQKRILLLSYQNLENKNFVRLINCAYAAQKMKGKMVSSARCDFIFFINM